MAIYNDLQTWSDGLPILKVIPDGKSLPVVLQIRAKEGEKPISAKFSLNLGKCSTCEHAEYACTCTHSDEEKGHKSHPH